MTTSGPVQDALAGSGVGMKESTTMTMTTQAEYARAKLRELALCKRIAPFQSGDEDLVCGNDLIPLVAGNGQLVHDPAFIRRLRNATYDSEWPGR
jgi:hypothetical protein